MKNKILNYCLVLCIGLLFACKKDKDPEPEPIPVPVPTVEENKQKVETTGIQVVTTMRELNNLQATAYVENFTNYLDIASPSNGNKSAVRNNAAIKLLYNIKSLTKNQISLIDLFSSMKGINEKSVKADSSSIQFQFDEVKGIYTWTPTNPDSTKWVYTATGNDIVFKFPSTDLGTSNNAVITISYTGINGVVLPLGLDEEYSYDVPGNINLSFKVDGTTYISYDLTITYNPDGFPATIVSTLTISPFSFIVNINYSTANVGVMYTFKKNTQIILQYGADVTGNFAVSDIENLMVEDSSYSVDYNGDTIWSYWTDADPDLIDNVFHNAHAFVQIFDIKIDGTLNTAALANAIRTIDENNSNGTITDDQATVQASAAINTNLNMYLKNMATGNLIANLKTYTYTETNEWTEWVWDEATQQYIEIPVSETYTEIGFKFYFPDGSSVDADTYFENGFGDLVTQINQFIAELNTDYNLGAEPIDYSGTN